MKTDVDQRAQIDVRQWAANWRQASAELDAERWRRLAAMTDDDRRIMVLELLSLYQPEKPGDDGEGLLAIQKAFEKWRWTRWSSSRREYSWPPRRCFVERATVWAWSRDIEFSVCSAEDLIIYKLAAARPHDLVDMEGVVRLQWRHLDVERIRVRAGQLSDMLEGPDMLEPFERALAKATETDFP